LCEKKLTFHWAIDNRWDGIAGEGGPGRVGWPKWSGWWPPPNRRACTTPGRLSSCSLQSWSVAVAIAATMNKEKLMKMASAVRTGGKGSVRR